MDLRRNPNSAHGTSALRAAYDRYHDRERGVDHDRANGLGHDRGVRSGVDLARFLDVDFGRSGDGDYRLLLRRRLRETPERLLPRK